MPRTQITAAALALAAIVGNACPAWAWGADGHRLISRVAIETLPADLPEFVRSADAAAEISALGPEADRLKGSGAAWDADNDRGHFVDIADDGTIGGAVRLDSLPSTREAYDTALRAAGSDQYRVGYLPYEIIDGYEAVVTDFAYWRANMAAQAAASTDADRRDLAAEQRLRETLTLRDIGYWSHFVGDGSQPLHLSVHYNGWGDGPNPHGYSRSHTIHVRFETALVRETQNDAGVRAHVAPYVASAAPITTRVEAYLAASQAAVPRVYELEAQGAIDGATPAAAQFVSERLGAGATMLRDAIAGAWTASATRNLRD